MIEGLELNVEAEVCQWDSGRIMVCATAAEVLNVWRLLFSVLRLPNSCFLHPSRRWRRVSVVVGHAFRVFFSRLFVVLKHRNNGSRTLAVVFLFVVTPTCISPSTNNLVKEFERMIPF